MSKDRYIVKPKDDLRRKVWHPKDNRWDDSSELSPEHTTDDRSYAGKMAEDASRRDPDTNRKVSSPTPVKIVPVKISE